MLDASFRIALRSFQQQKEQKLSSMLLQEAHLGAATPRRSRVSSIFQQKTIKQDDIDADFLKHVAFAAQRSSPVATETAMSEDNAATSKTLQPASPPPTVYLADKSRSLQADTQPADAGEFTLAKIEQSIAEIEAELGWTSDSAALAGMSIPEDAVKSKTLQPSILSTAHAGRLHTSHLCGMTLSPCCIKCARQASYSLLNLVADA